MKGTWMLLVLAILLLFGPHGPVMADHGNLIIDAAHGALSGTYDRILLILLPAAVMHAVWRRGKRRKMHEA